MYRWTPCCYRCKYPISKKRGDPMPDCPKAASLFTTGWHHVWQNVSSSANAYPQVCTAASSATRSESAWPLVIPRRARQEYGAPECSQSRGWPRYSVPQSQRDGAEPQGGEPLARLNVGRMQRSGSHRAGPLTACRTSWTH